MSTFAMTKILDNFTLPPQLAGLIIEVLEEQGVSRTRVLHNTGIRPVLLERDDTYLTYQQMLTLIENSLGLSNISGLGLTVGSRENISTLGLLGYAIMSCATYREGFDIGLRYYRAAAGMMLLSTTEEEGQIKIQMESPCPLGKALPFCVEETIAGTLAIGSLLLQKKACPLKVSLTYCKPEYAQKYQKMFDCPILYNQPINALWITPPDDTPLQHSDPISAQITVKLVEEMLEKQSNEHDFVINVRRILLRSPGQFPDMESVAQELGMSSRTLRRQLNELETSFKLIFDDVRSQLAIDYLKNSKLMLEEISALLGYTELTNFRRAFKLWTGHPPSYYRPC